MRNRLKAVKRRDWKLRIDDILLAIDKIEGYLAGMTWENFAEDARTIDAVIRNIEIIGEATAYVPGGVKRRNEGIPWEKLRLLRNFLAHEYFGVDHRMVWETATRNLPPLKPALAKSLKTEISRRKRRPRGK